MSFVSVQCGSLCVECESGRLTSELGFWVQIECVFEQVVFAEGVFSVRVRGECPLAKAALRVCPRRVR